MKVGADVLTTPFKYGSFEEVAHPEGGVALKTSAGKYKSLTPDGTWQPDSDNMGPWEQFFANGGNYSAYRSDTNATYVFGRTVVGQ